jgi:hypothetical protein
LVLATITMRTSRAVLPPSTTNRAVGLAADSSAVCGVERAAEGHVDGAAEMLGAGLSAQPPAATAAATTIAAALAAVTFWSPSR